MKQIALVLTLFLLSQSAAAQDLTFYGVLPAFSQTGDINSQIKYNLFVSTTLNAFERQVNGTRYPASNLKLYVQPSIIFIYSPNLNFAGSYTYQRSHPFNDLYVNEHRLWQQVIFSVPLFEGRMTNRFRFEERFIQNRTTGKYPLFTRFRYQVGFNKPLQGRKIDPKEIYFNTYNEFYFSLTGEKNAVYSENWTYAGFGYGIGPRSKIEIGYVLQLSVRNKNQDRQYLHLAQILWATSLLSGKNKG